jgi:hypothetical protein
VATERSVYRGPFFHQPDLGPNLRFGKPEIGWIYPLKCGVLREYWQILYAELKA